MLNWRMHFGTNPLLFVMFVLIFVLGCHKLLPLSCNIGHSSIQNLSSRHSRSQKLVLHLKLSIYQPITINLVDNSVLFRNKVRAHASFVLSLNLS
jgi:hypothetical protein